MIRWPNLSLHILKMKTTYNGSELKLLNKEYLSSNGRQTQYDKSRKSQQPLMEHICSVTIFGKIHEYLSQWIREQLARKGGHCKVCVDKWGYILIYNVCDIDIYFIQECASLKLLILTMCSTEQYNMWTHVHQGPSL